MSATHHAKKFFPAALALAASSLVSTNALAQSSMSIYGMLDISVGSFQYSNVDGTGTNKRVTKVDSNQMVTSFIGFKGVEDLGSGTKAGFAIETFLQPDTGAAGRSTTDVFWGRAANVWLSSEIGKLTIGRQGNLLFGHVASYNPFGGAFGLSPAVRLSYHGMWGNDKGDSGWSNAVGYDSPNFGGLTMSAQMQLGEKTDQSEGTSYGVGFKYAAGPFSLGGAWQTLRSAEAPKGDFTAGQRQTFGLVSASFDAGFAKLFGQYGQYENRGFAAAARIDTIFYQLGASVPVSPSSKILASYGETKEKAVEGGTTPKTRHGIFTVAYDHWLSKRTDLYLAVMMDNEKLPSFAKGYSYVAGMRHAF